MMSCTSGAFALMGQRIAEGKAILQQATASANTMSPLCDITAGAWSALKVVAKQGVLQAHA